MSKQLNDTYQLIWQLSRINSNFKSLVLLSARHAQKLSNSKKTSAQYRADIAALERHILALEATVKKLSKAPSTLEIKKEPTKALRFRAGGFATLRKKLELCAEQMGKLINVSAQTVYHWEAKKSRPRASQLPAIADARKLNKKQARAKLGI